MLWVDLKNSKIKITDATAFAFAQGSLCHVYGVRLQELHNITRRVLTCLTRRDALSKVNAKCRLTCAATAHLSSVYILPLCWPWMRVEYMIVLHWSRSARGAACLLCMITTTLARQQRALAGLRCSSGNR